MILGVALSTPSHAKKITNHDGVTAHAPVYVIAEGFRDARGLAADGEGNVYVSDRKAGTVTWIAPDGTQTIVASRLHKPAGLALDPSGLLLIAEDGRERVVRLETRGTLTPVATGIKHPQWLAVGADGTLYISARGLKHGRAKGHDRDDDDEYEPGREMIVAVGPGGGPSVFADGFRDLAGLAAESGALYVASRGTGRRGDDVVLQIPILAGGEAGEPRTVGAEGVLRRPTGVAIDGLGALWVSAEAWRLDRWRSHHVLAKIHPNGTYTQFAWDLERLPEGLAFDGKGNLYIATGRSGRVLRFGAPEPPALTGGPYTNQSPLTVQGTTEPGARVDLFVNDGLAPVSANADDAGAFALAAELAHNADNYLEAYATAYGGAGLTSGPSGIAVTHDNIPPSVGFTSPGARVQSTVTVQAQAGDDGSQLATLALTADRAPLGATVSPALPAASASATATWDTNSLSNGAYTLLAVATDRAGNTATATHVVLVEHEQGPTLEVSATTVAGGAQVTMTLTNGPGGSSAWLSLAETAMPDVGLIQWTPVGAGVTTRTWTVTMPVTPGTYEFRLFPDGGHTRVATSPTVTVSAAMNPVPVLESISPTFVSSGSDVALTVTGRNFVSSSVVRLNGADRPTTFVSATQLRASILASDLAAGGTAQVTVFTPEPGGGLTAALPLEINTGPTLTVSATRVAPGTSVTVTLTNGLGGTFDWLAFALSSDADTRYVTWAYVGNGVTSRTWTVTAPATPGTYEFRLFLNNVYIRAATSPPVTVAP